MSKRSELRAINRAKKQGIDLVAEKKLCEERKAAREAEWEDQQKKDREAARLLNISMAMRMYASTRQNLLTALTEVCVDGKLKKSAKSFNRSIFSCQFAIRYNPFQIHWTLFNVFKDIGVLYSYSRNLEDHFNDVEDTQHDYVKINIDNVLNYALEYFPRWGLESCIKTIRVLFDEYQRQLPLSEKWDTVVEAQRAKKEDLMLAGANMPLIRSFPFHLKFSYNDVEQLTERFYQENRTQIDALNS